MERQTQLPTQSRQAEQRQVVHTCPRCNKNPLSDSQQLCTSCALEEEAEARAAEEDARTAREAKQPAPARDSPKDEIGSFDKHPNEPTQTKPQQTTKAPTSKAPPRAQQPAPARAAGPQIGISTGRKDKRPRLVVYGPGSVGKTSLMGEAPNVVILPCEVGAEGLDVARLDEIDFGDGKKRAPRSFSEVRWCIRWLLENDHSFEFFGIDGIGALEAMVHQQVVADYNKSPHKKGEAGTLNEVGGGYKTGQENAVDKWRLLIGDLDRLREQRGMGIIITGHALVRKFDDPMSVAFDRYQLKLDERAAGVLFEWADLVLFANFIDRTKKVGRKFKGVGGRERALYSERTAAYDAKQRAPYVLPASLPMPEGNAFGSLMHQIEMRKHPDLIRAAIHEALEQLVGIKVQVRDGEALVVDLALAELEKNPSPERLLHLKNRLDVRVAALEEEREAAQDTASGEGGEQ